MIRRWTALFAAFVVSALPLLAADPVPARPSPSDTVVAGDPPIKMSTIENHLRLMEFVLGTRFTSAQKDRFFELVKKEGAEIGKEDRVEFLSADDLVATMSAMSDFQRTFIADMLRSDFEGTAAEDPSDPAAQLFAGLAGAVDKEIARVGSHSLTLQSLEALIEFLGVCRGYPQAPKPLSDEEKDRLLRLLAAEFGKLSEPVRAALSGFDHRWYLLRTALAGSPAEKVTAWKSALVAPFTASGQSPASGTPVFDGVPLDTLIQPNLYQEMASAAIALGENPHGWTATPTVHAW